ncbi:MAG: hypothetical protein PWQ55_2198 [Chloroflexota bacterium]|nr:hypothetical protein [Chloroflexota bacterium]
MMRALNKLFKLLIFIGLIFPLVLTGFNPIPVTGLSVQSSDLMTDPVAYGPDTNQAEAPATSVNSSAELEKFVEEVFNGQAGTIRGIYAEGVMEYPVVQQPSGQAGFVSEQQNVVTEFAMARDYGVTGILAHNFLAGQSFFDLSKDDTIQVVYGDGSTQTYQIVNVLQYQALSPDSPTSSFTDLDNGETLSASQLFKKVYMGSGHLTLQTCIQVGSEDSWGRLFLIAEPVA